jgi:uncharacterized protein (DUF433 family)
VVERSGCEACPVFSHCGKISAKRIKGDFAMTITVNGQSSIVRTERGLTLAGTRITLYAILDYLHAEWPPKLIQQWLDLSDQQMADVLNYLANHRAEVEQEYQQVVQQGKELRQYWDNRLQEHLARQPQKFLSAEQAILRAKFQAWKAQHTPA